jgi:hypothetical protein
MQVKVLISDVLRLQCARQRSLQKATRSFGALLEHDAPSVNDFLVQAKWTASRYAQAVSAWRRHVTVLRDHAGASINKWFLVGTASADGGRAR